ncbi:hypothetical protein R1flu_021658 [Riccia fluitans]|uniref:RING-type E3 ubiquitin transferase n=1 Tax=Riccia fluitans TaxID=41844 RepID=A0ABD1ZQD8_9MARC
MNVEVKEILESDLFSLHTHDYMFMMVQFGCVDYTTCSPAAILHEVGNILEDQIANISDLYNRSNSTEYTANECYVGGANNETGSVTFISHIKQVNQSSITEREPVVMGYLEVKPASHLWFIFDSPLVVLSRKIKRRVEYGTELKDINKPVIDTITKAISEEGVCKNMYHNVVRCNSETPNRTVFLERNCSKAAGLCTLAGRYVLLEDEPGIDFPRLLNESKVLEAANDRKPFVCFGPGKQNIASWFVFTAGVMVGLVCSIFL